MRRSSRMTTGLFPLGRIFTRANAREFEVEPKRTVAAAPLLVALQTYIDLALSQAQYEYLAEDHVHYGEIPGFAGVYASGDTKEACAYELRDVLEEWIVLRLEEGRS